MRRTLAVRIDQSTWPRGNRLPAFPPTFHIGRQYFDINIPSALLWIGYLTTPTSSTGISLSEFWAWVRYLAAIAEDPGMRLTQSFADLDSHQKTILSDDFGMGFPILWLSERLTFNHIVDGRYFMQRLAATVGANQRRTAKRGPNKTPDFVARDTSGVWHVVECKGTQSGSVYSKKQLVSGGAQKRAITFPPHYTGQKLVCGLNIGVENGKGSTLTIVDPEPEDPFEISSGQVEFAEDAALRGVMSRVLRLSGFEIAAEATAAPLGRSPGSRRYDSPRSEEFRRRTVEERNERARDELDATRGERLFGGKYRGRETYIDLPRPVLVDDKPMTRVRLRQGVNEEFLSRLRSQPTIEDPDFGDKVWNENGRSLSSGDSGSSVLKIGNIFRSELEID